MCDEQNLQVGQRPGGRRPGGPEAGLEGGGLRVAEVGEGVDGLPGLQVLGHTHRRP